MVAQRFLHNHLTRLVLQYDVPVAAEELSHKLSEQASFEVCEICDTRIAFDSMDTAQCAQGHTFGASHRSRVASLY